jgi:hypothetical protein
MNAPTYGVVRRDKNGWSKSMDMALDEAERAEAEHAAQVDKRAEAAWELLKRGQDWQSWKVIGEGLHEGRLWSMRKAATNQPVGKTYNRAFSDWLDARKWTREIDRSTRNHAMWCHENVAAIEQWRETLATSQRQMINHPSTVKRNYEKTQSEKTIAKKTERAKQVKIDVDELEKIQGDLAKFKKMAEADGSLFDLKKDSIKIIVATIAANMSPYRLNELQKELVGELARLKAVKKQAG